MLRKKKLFNWIVFVNFIVLTILNHGICNEETVNRVLRINTQTKDYKIVCYYVIKKTEFLKASRRILNIIEFIFKDNRLPQITFSSLLFPDEIDPTLCTHLIYAFANVVGNQVSLKLNFRPGLFISKKSETIVEDTVALKKKNKDLKVLLSIGGWNFNSTEFQLMIADDTSRKTFIDSILAALAKYGFDGLDIYSENPKNRGDVIYHESKAYLIPLCKELREAFKPFNYLLSAALPGNINIVSGSYEVMAELAKSLDFISIMAYGMASRLDLHGTWENVTIHHAPLYTSLKDKSRPISIDDVVKDWLRTGVPKKKLFMGVSTYGRSFAVTDENDKCPLIHTPIMSPAPRQVLTLLGGFVAYPEICIKMRLYDWKYKWLQDEKVPYVYSVNSPVLSWVGFDDVRSIDYKIEYLIKAGLGGAMMFSLDNDDFLNVCVEKNNYSILRVINYHLNKRIKVDYPDPNALFNVTKAIIEDNQLKKRLEATFESFDGSTYQMQDVLLFCECKKGLQKLELKSKTGGRKIVIFDCNQPDLVRPRLVDDNELKENVESLDSFAYTMTKTPADERISLPRNSSSHINRINILLLVSLFFACTLKEISSVF